MKKVILGIVFLSIFYGCSKDDGYINTNTAPNQPQLISPTNNATLILFNLEEPVYFEWTATTDIDNDVTGYHWYSDTNPNFNSPQNHHVTRNNTTSDFIELNTTYYWRVRAIDSNSNWSDYSETWSFYLQDGNAPSKPSLVFPLHETECSNDHLTFDWENSTVPSSDPISYKLHVSTSSDFSSNTDVYETDNSEYNIVLPQSTALYWKVEALAGTYNVFSETRSLYTQGVGINNTIPQLQYTFPNDEVTISNQSPELQWQASDAETSNSNLSYKVYFSEVGQDLELKTETTNILSYLINGLEVGKTYQWSIWVTDTGGATNVGEVYTFTVN